MLQYHCPNYNRLIGYKGLCWLCKADKKREQALNLRKEEIEEMQKYCIEHVEGLDCMREPEITYFWNCLSYHNIICEELQRAAVKKEAYYPCAIYYKAPEDVRDSLIAALMNCNDVRIASHLMECLAMQGDDKSLEILLELKKNPREWRKNLYVDSDFYAELGGWTFDKNGKITVTCCPSCVLEAHSVAFGSYDLDGTGNALFPYDGVAENEKYCWIEDCNIINCPDCKKPMRYLAQLPWDILTVNGGDGSLYIEICSDCKKVSLQHQQT